MKKITRLVCILISILILTSVLVSCDRAPGLYNALGFKMNVDYLLKLTLDVGNGEQVYNVPFDLYRNLFVHFKARVSTLVPVDEEGTNAKPATQAEQTTAIKEYVEDQLVSYYARLAICEKYGVGLTDNGQLYKDEFNKQVANYAETVSDEDLKDYKGTKEEYAREQYIKTIKSLGMTEEYFEYTYYVNLLNKRIKEVLVPNLKDIVSQSYTHFKEIYIEYTIGDSESEQAAYDNIYKAYEALQNGGDFDELMKEYNNNSTYSQALYVDSYGSIVNSRTNSTIATLISQILSALQEDEYSVVISGDGDNDQKGYFAIIYKMGFNDEDLYGNSSDSLVLFQYPYYGATSNSAHYTHFTDLIEAYEQNMRVEPYDEKVYARVAVNTMF